MDIDAEGIFLEPVGVVWGLDGDGEDGAPAFGRGERIIDIMALDPVDAEAVVGRADHARHFDRDLLLADFGEGIVGAGVIIERERALVGDVFVGVEPVLPQHDRRRPRCCGLL